MHILSLSAVYIGFCLATFASSASALNVLQLDISKPKFNSQQRQRLRRDTATESLTNLKTFYSASISIGTPQQQLQLQIDTGSSDIWAFSSARRCEAQANNCVGGTFDPSRSSTFTAGQQGGFRIIYADESTAQGDFFTDVLRIGPEGGQVSVNRQQVALVTNTAVTNGILGIGFASGEAKCSNITGPCQTYPTLTQNLVSANIINTQAYSIWLNNRDADAGSILFGGLDTSRFTGELVTVPVVPEEETGEYTSFTVAWTGLTLNTPSGDQQQFFEEGSAVPAILDTGTSLSYVPDDLAMAIADIFGATYDPQFEGYLAPCSLQNTTTSFDFQFGGSRGAVIRVPIRDLLLDAAFFSNGNAATSGDDETVCALGIQPTGENPILLGDTFLRSAYVVHDLDRKQVSLAQANFNPTGSDIQEITNDNGLPRNSVTATSASVVQTATRVPSPGLPSSVRLSSSMTRTPSSSSTTLPRSTASPISMSPSISIRSSSLTLSTLFSSATSSTSHTLMISTTSRTLIVPTTSRIPIISTTSRASITPRASSTLFIPSKSLASFIPPAPSTLVILSAPVASSASSTPSAASTPSASDAAATPPTYTGAAARPALTGHSFLKINSGLWMAIITTIFVTLGGGLLLL